MHNSSCRPLRWCPLAAALLLLAGGAAQAQISGNHYPMGSEGIKNASLPEKELFMKNYNLFYHADEFRDANGDKAPGTFGVFAYVNAPRVFYFPDWEFLGSKVGADVTVPIIHTDLTLGGTKFSKAGLGDILVESVLIGWHYPRVDLARAFGVWAPTGKWSGPSARPSSPRSNWALSVTAPSRSSMTPAVRAPRAWASAPAPSRTGSRPSTS